MSIYLVFMWILFFLFSYTLFSSSFFFVWCFQILGSDWYRLCPSTNLQTYWLDDFNRLGAVISRLNCTPAGLEGSRVEWSALHWPTVHCLTRHWLSNICHSVQLLCATTGDIVFVLAHFSHSTKTNSSSTTGRHNNQLYLNKFYLSIIHTMAL